MVGTEEPGSISGARSGQPGLSPVHGEVTERGQMCAPSAVAAHPIPAEPWRLSCVERLPLSRVHQEAWARLCVGAFFSPVCCARHCTNKCISPLGFRRQLIINRVLPAPRGCSTGRGGCRLSPGWAAPRLPCCGELGSQGRQQGFSYIFGNPQGAGLRLCQGKGCLSACSRLGWTPRAELG